MPIHLVCSCGQALSLAEDLAGKEAPCPACGRRIRVPVMGILAGKAPSRPPALPSRPSPLAPRFSLTAGAVLVVLTGSLVFFINRSTKPEPENIATLPKKTADPDPPPIKETDSPPIKSAKPGEVLPNLPEPSPRIEPPKTDQKKPSPPKSEPPKTVPLPPVPPVPVPPILEITRVEPEKLQAGGKLTVKLGAGERGGVNPPTTPRKDLIFQYRADPKEDWKPAPGGMVVVGPVKGPELALEFRAVDANGTPSPILRRSWKVQPVPPANLISGPLRLEWKLKAGDFFFQELRVVQKPRYLVSGLPFATTLEYMVVSRFTVEKAGDKELVVRQKVEGARLIQADPLTAPLLGPAAVKLPGTTFTIHLNPQMEVTRFEGGKNEVMVKGLPNPGGIEGLQMASLLDRDGWKEMAQLTFFQPNRPLKPGEKWSQPLTHNWGALGRWTGKTHYIYAGGEGKIHRINYLLQLAYQPPRAGRGVPAPRLPIAGAVFQPQQAGGAILFDQARGKVVEAQEYFRVKGRIGLLLLGMNTPVDIEEDQFFHLKIFSTKPNLPKSNPPKME